MSANLARDPKYLTFATETVKQGYIKARKAWLRTDEGQAYMGEQNRYKKGSLEALTYQLIRDEVDEIRERCEGIREELSPWEEGYDESLKVTLLDAFSGDDDELRLFQDRFEDLIASCEKLSDLFWGDGWGGRLPDQDRIVKHFDDIFAGTMGSAFKMYGYDDHQLDYFSLCEFSAELAERESAKRLMKLTKEELLRMFGACMGVAVSVLDVRSRFQRLMGQLELLTGERLEMLRDIRGVDTAYSEAERNGFRDGATTRHFERVLRAMPDEVWVG